MLTSLKKVALAGLGVKRRVQKTLDALAREGEASEGEDARRLKAIMEMAERGKEEIKQKMGDIRRRVSCTIPTRADLERLEKKIDDLSVRRE